MIRIMHSLILIPSCFLLYSCAPNSTMNLYNNTGEELIVILSDKAMIWSPNSTIMISGKGGDIDWEELIFREKISDTPQGIAPYLYIFTGDGKILTYALFSIQFSNQFPSEYKEKRFTSNLQLEVNWNFYGDFDGRPFPIKIDYSNDQLSKLQPGFDPTIDGDGDKISNNEWGQKHFAIGAIGGHNT